jgi:hypothetical protein
MPHAFASPGGRSSRTHAKPPHGHKSDERTVTRFGEAGPEHRSSAANEGNVRSGSIGGSPSTRVNQTPPMLLPHLHARPAD